MEHNQSFNDQDIGEHYSNQTFQNIENQDGIRLSWNVWPITQVKTDSVPISCLYNVKQSCVRLKTEPIFCSKCQSVLCPFSYVDIGMRFWTCSFCNSKNLFNNNVDINLLSELDETATTIEYITSRQSAFPPIFLILIDISTYDQERHEMMIRTVIKAIELLPDNSMIGIIQYGTNINVYSFNTESLQTIYQFSGNFSYQKKNIRGMEDIRHFLVKKTDNITEILKIIQNLKKDPFPILDGFRANRCTGAALSFAISFLEGPFIDNPVKYMLFTQGPCTYGPGAVATQEISADLKIDLVKAEEFYTNIGERLNNLGHSVDIYGETIADIGFKQMKPMITSCGGTIILAQDFEERIIQQSLEILYKTDEVGVLDCGFNAKIQLKTTNNIKCKSFLGDGKSKGLGWKIGFLIPTTNITILFEPTENTKTNSYGYVQILTQYTRSDRKIITRVTTFARLFSNDKIQQCDGFDEEAACITQSRIFCNHPFENIFDLETAIDKHLIRFTKKYATWDKNNPDSLVLPSTMNYYLNFMFFFRRSFVIQTDGISADESAYFKTLLYKLKVSDALKLIKPTLQCYTYQGDFYPLELSTDAMTDDVILILDSFHNVVQWDGLNIMAWKKEGLQNHPDYKFFKQTLEDAKNTSMELLKDRIPAPQFKETGAGKSQERILMTYLCSGTGGGIKTQKIDFSRFYNALCKHIVNSD